MQQGSANSAPRLRRLQPPRHDHHHHHNHRPLRHLYEESRALEPSDPSPSSPDLSESAASLRRHVADSLMQHHRSNERSKHAIQPVSPASYGSSMEITPYNPAITPSSSIDYKGKPTDSAGYSLKTSTELLKVLNRIWILEEQHSSNMSLVKALKKELDHARARIKELVRSQQTDRHKMDELAKQITVRKSEERDWINTALQSARDELEDERKLRKRSESLHRKLARELHETKGSLAGVSKVLERERKSRELLEGLCDEFAWGVRDYEQEFRSLRTVRTEKDRPILHISESWLDERMQTKLTEENKSCAVEKLSSEIETFLRTKRTAKPTAYRSSLESIPLNVAVSAPRDEGDEEDSSSSGSYCFELQKASGAGSKSHLNEFEEPELASQERNKNCGGKASEENLPRMHEITEEENNSDRKNKTKGHYNGNIIPPENELALDSFGNSVWRASPVRQWTEKLPANENEISESSSRLPPECKESTLKAKLLEARRRGQRSRSRLKGSKVCL